mmetsp:Transcript_34256/g.52604  ORF Transcript_34256/g.52604 Transcript_34256/m.52604 type:complete len:189 (-) Transcript_34256:1020-1586(-)
MIQTIARALLLSFLVSSSHAFAPMNRGSVAFRATPVTSLKMAKVDEAIALYQERFPGEVDKKRLSTNFAELSKIYGEDNALTMIGKEPKALLFNSANFGPSFVEFEKIFGTEPAIGMVVRNPGLLAVPPTGYSGADRSDGQTMFFSYLIDITRPFGKILLPLLLLLVLTPAIEGVTGIRIKETLFGGN